MCKYDYYIHELMLEGNKKQADRFIELKRKENNNWQNSIYADTDSQMKDID